MNGPGSQCLGTLLLLALPFSCWAQEADPFALEGVEEEVMEEQPVIEDEITVGAYYLDDDAFRYGKYTGLTDEGFEWNLKPQYLPYYRLAGYANDLGLLAEEIDPEHGELLGNFPQAFSHIGLVNAAWAISEAERQAKHAA